LFCIGLRQLRGYGSPLLWATPAQAAALEVDALNVLGVGIQQVYTPSMTQQLRGGQVELEV
jgi:hypothetical protein